MAAASILPARSSPSSSPEVRVRTLPPYRVLYDLPDKTEVVVLIGGRGGGKTRGASVFASFSATVKRKRIVVLRDEKALIRESILNEILLRFDAADGENQLLSRQFSRLDTGIKDLATGEMLIFTKGFRASRTDKTANMKGVSNIDIAIVEEAEDIREEDKFNTFADSVRKEGAIIVIILNTPDIQHWIVRRFFNLELVEDGFWKLIPKKLPGFVCIQTSYKDNPYLPEHIVRNYEGYGDKNSHLYNPFYFKTAILGYASSGRKGQVHKKVKTIKLEDYLELPYKEIYGQDFGTASPAGLVGCKTYKNTVWCRQLNYFPKSTLDIGKMYCLLKFGPKDRVVADNADKDALEKLKSGWSVQELSPKDLEDYRDLVRGFYMVPSKKGPDSITYGIDLMDSLELFAVEESKDLWNEILNRIYAKDKNDNYTNDPEPGWDHLMDPWMYVCVDIFGTERGKKSGLGGKTGYFR